MRSSSRTRRVSVNSSRRASSRSRRASVASSRCVSALSRESATSLANARTSSSATSSPTSPIHPPAAAGACRGVDGSGAGDEVAPPTTRVRGRIPAANESGLRFPLRTAARRRDGTESAAGGDALRADGDAETAAAAAAAAAADPAARASAL